MSVASFVLIFGSAWFALALICGMLAEYRHKIVAALRYEPMPGEQRFRAGQPVEPRDA